MTSPIQTPFADHGDPFMPWPNNSPTPEDLPGIPDAELAQLPVELLAVLQREEAQA